MTPAVTSRPFSAQEEQFVEQTIIQFASATANRDIYSMHYLLHENFQALVVDEEETLVSKSDYMKMLVEKNFGGEQQKVEIPYLDVSLNTAAAKVKIIGKDVKTEVYCHLFMNANGSWQILHVLQYATERI